ncbi:hypothetical protein BaRGS_00010953 [Batillaria attramentaria]|uniref:Uncharacterized protein n=1 Tax=Batillaria attramentaria TaxID=370345 RepID=A0ABD0LE33_9CAEN
MMINGTLVIVSDWKMEATYPLLSGHGTCNNKKLRSVVTATRARHLSRWYSYKHQSVSSTSPPNSTSCLSQLPQACNLHLLGGM